MVREMTREIYAQSIYVQSISFKGKLLGIGSKYLSHLVWRTSEIWAKAWITKTQFSINTIIQRWRYKQKFSGAEISQI